MRTRLYLPSEERRAADFLSLSAGIEPAKFRFKRKHANHYATEPRSILIFSHSIFAYVLQDASFLYFFQPYHRALDTDHRGIAMQNVYLFCQNSVVGTPVYTLD
jgi:hypothetical protein